MENLPSTAPSVARLIGELNKLPGVGPKSAQRLAYHLIRVPDAAEALAEAVIGVKERVFFCSRCQNLTDMDPCGVCSDPRRDQTQVCVVEGPLDILAVERTNCYRGLYHVLHGVISPMNGIGPEELKLKELAARLQDSDVQEVIIATNPTLEGEATAMYIQRHLSRDDLRITRLARGLPVGGSLEHTDETTLSRAFQGRQDL
jgi:recombination protein RecR